MYLIMYLINLYLFFIRIINCRDSYTIMSDMCVSITI